MEGLYKDLERRIEASQPGLCPVDLARAFLELCYAQTCGKCVPCRIGLKQLMLLIQDVLDGKATMDTLKLMEETALAVMEAADCAIGYEAANMVYKGLDRLPGRVYRACEARPLYLCGLPAGALRDPVSGPCGYPGIYRPGPGGQVCGRHPPDPEGQSLPHLLRLHMRASL